MGSEEDFEFELEEELVKQESNKGPSKARLVKDLPKERKKVQTLPVDERTDKRKVVGKKVDIKVEKEELDEPRTMKAKKVPIADGIKRRLAQNKREIERLRREIREVKDDKKAFELELESLEEEFEKLKSEKERLEEEINHKVAVANALEKKQNRTQKDFDNFKKRTNEEIERKAKLNQKKLLLGVIDTLDNMDRAMIEIGKVKLESNQKTITSGLESIRKSLIKILTDQGIEPIDPLNKPFDPHFHDAVDTIMDRTVNENTVLTVEAKGYLMGDMVLRPAKVKVSVGGKPWPKEERIRPETVEEPPKETKGRSVEEEGPKRKQSKDELDELDEVEEDELDELIEEIDDLTGRR